MAGIVETVYEVSGAMVLTKVVVVVGTGAVDVHGAAGTVTVVEPLLPVTDIVEVTS